MPGALKPSDNLSKKSNVIPSINRRTEATAEDFKELSDIANNHANLLDELTQAENRNLFYGVFETKALLEATFENPEENGIAIIDPQVGQQTIATFENGVWTYNEVTAPILFYPTKLDRPQNGQEGIWYIVLDEKRAYLWYGAGWLSIGTDGQNGISAYQVAVAFGFEGTETEWLASLIGDSAYKIAVSNGFEGTEAEWVVSLGGIPGKNAYEVAQDEGFIGTVEEWLLSLQGLPGTPGDTGNSAYQIWLDAGNVGTEQDFLLSIKGGKGDTGLTAYEVWLLQGNEGSEQEYLDSLKGAPGDVSAQQLAIAKQEAIDEAKAYTDSLHVDGSDSITDSYDTMADLYASQGTQIDGELFIVVDASGHSTVGAGWAFFEYLGTITSTEADYRKLSEEESLDAAGSVDTSNLAKLNQNNYFNSGLQVITTSKPYEALDITKPQEDLGSTLFIKSLTEKTNGLWSQILFNNGIDDGYGYVRLIARRVQSFSSEFIIAIEGVERFKINNSGKVSFGDNGPLITLNRRNIFEKQITIRADSDTDLDLTAESQAAEQSLRIRSNSWCQLEIDPSSNNKSFRIIAAAQSSLDRTVHFVLRGVEYITIQKKGFFGEDHISFNNQKIKGLGNLDLSDLGEYPDDSAASAGGVAVGYGYINSNTGAVHKRRS